MGIVNLDTQEVQEQLENLETNKVDATDKGAANGVASLDENSQVPLAQLPPAAKAVTVVDTIASRDALTEAQRYEGLRVFVLDATADESVDSGGAFYILKSGLTNSDWHKTTEDESLDIDWTVFLNKTTETLDNINEGSDKKHLTAALKAAYDSAVGHTSVRSGNPHEVTKSNVGLGSVPNLDTTNAVAKAHDQNSDTKLDEGGDNEVSAAEINVHMTDPDAHHDNSNDPTADEKAALDGTSGTPSSTNKFVTNEDERLSDSRTPESHGNEAHDSAFITSEDVTYENLNSNSSLDTEVGNEANGATLGTAVGYTSVGSNFGAAVGLQAQASTYGAAVGADSLGNSYSAAIGYRAITYGGVGSHFGIALGAWTTSERHGEFWIGADTADPNDVGRGSVQYYGVINGGNAATEIFVRDKTGARLTLQSSSTIVGRIIATAFDPSAGESMAWKGEFHITNIAGTTTLHAGATPSVISDPDSNAWTLALFADDTTDALRIKFTPDGSNDTEITVVVEYAEIRT